MCLAIFKPAGVVVGRKRLQAGFDNNPHGAGFGYVKDGTWHLLKGFFDFPAFIKAYREHITDDIPAVVHFRWATVGAKTVENCHPFPVVNGVLIHNGPQIQRLEDKATDRSDSRIFAEDIIGGMDKETLIRLRPLIEGYLEYNKVIVLHNDGEALIFNEKLGKWNNGAWYSNDGYTSRDYEYYNAKSWNKNTKTTAIPLTTLPKLMPAETLWDKMVDTVYDRMNLLPNANNYDFTDTHRPPPTEQELYVLLGPEVMDYVLQYVDVEDWIYEPELDMFFYMDIREGDYVDLESGVTYFEMMDEPEDVLDTPGLRDEDPEPRMQLTH